MAKTSEKTTGQDDEVRADIEFARNLKLSGASARYARDAIRRRKEADAGSSATAPDTSSDSKGS